jgi:hypothetical protein
MRNVVRRAVIAAGSLAVVLGTGTGVAAAAQTPALAWSPPGPVSFGTLAPGATSAPQVFTLKNNGGSASAALAITVTPASGFTITADHCTGTSLGPGKSCTVAVTYTPATPGQAGQATLKATGNKAATTASLTLTGASAKATPAITTTQKPATAAAGSAVADEATVTGGDNPGGTVTFNLYDNATCSGTALFTDTETLAGGTATSASYTATAVGTDYWAATYNGDGANNQVSSGCGYAPVTLSGTPCVTDATSGQSYTNLQDAVNAATAGDTLDITGTCKGTTTIGENLTLTGSTANATLDDSGGQGTVLTIAYGATVTLNTLTITGGNPVGFNSGGGIANEGTATLNGSTVTGNTADNGGGISNYDTMTLNGSTITGNTAASDGGGIYNGGTLTLNSDSTVGNSTVADNTADTQGTSDVGAGGGISNDGSLTLNGSSTVTGNNGGAGYGGGIFNESGTVTMNGTSTVTSNTAASGGGIMTGCASGLNNAVAGTSGNVYSNHPDDIVSLQPC